MPDTLTTDRLILRPLRASDASDYVDAFANWSTVSMLTRPKWPVQRREIDTFLSTVADEPWTYAITRPSSDRMIGVVSIVDHLGYWLHQDHRGQGFMAEAASAAIDAWFESPAHEALVSGVFDGNPASRRVLNRLGFAETGVSLAFCNARGADVAHIDMVLPRAVWQMARAA